MNHNYDGVTFYLTDNKVFLSFSIIKSYIETTINPIDGLPRYIDYKLI